MKEILPIKPLDIIPFQKGFLIVSAEGKDADGNVKLAFMAYDTTTGKLNPVTKSVYMLNKFGTAYKEIVEQIVDYVSCSTGFLGNNLTHIVYPTGEMGTFGKDGTLLWTGDLMYHDSPVRSIAVDGKYIWCAVPDQNCIIRYSLNLKKVEFRIGGTKSNVFDKPMSVYKSDNLLYVCNKNSCNIKTVNLDNYEVHDYKLFDSAVLRYFQVNNMEIVTLSTGIFII